MLRVYVGIDFGTSFTKVAFKASNGRSGDLEMNPSGCGEERFFLPSELDCEESSLRLFFHERPGCTRLRYFKYAMVEQGKSLANKILPNLDKLDSKNLGKSDNVAEFCCSVFFLAHVIVEAREKIARILSWDRHEISFQFNMGCPISAFQDPRRNTYLSALRCAAALADSDCFEEGMTLEYVRRFCVPEVLKDKENYNVIPELYAEAYGFIDDSTTPRGFHCLLDVGGGSVDFAVIKIDDNDVTVYSQGVLSLGMEILLDEIYPDSRNRNGNREKLMQNKALIIRVKDKNCLTCKPTILPYVFRQALMKTVVKVKDMNYGLMNVQYQNGTFPMHYYGGGRECRWYRSIIEEHNRHLNGLNIPPLQAAAADSPLVEARLAIARNLTSIQDFDAEFPEMNRLQLHKKLFAIWDNSPSDKGDDFLILP